MLSREMLVEAGRVLKDLEDARMTYWFFFPIIQKREDPFTNPFLTRLSEMIDAWQDYYLSLIRAHTIACEIAALNIS
jgi:hypothetical protein